MDFFDGHGTEGRDGGLQQGLLLLQELVLPLGDVVSTMTQHISFHLLQEVLK